MIIKIKREVLHQMARSCVPGMAQEPWPSATRLELQRQAELVAQATAEKHGRLPVTIEVV